MGYNAEKSAASSDRSAAEKPWLSGGVGRIGVTALSTAQKSAGTSRERPLSIS